MNSNKIKNIVFYNSNGIMQACIFNTDGTTKKVSGSEGYSLIKEIALENGIKTASEFNKVFKNLGAEMYGLTGFFIGLASFMGPILTKIFIKEDSDYLIIYSIGGAFCVIKFIALLFFDENKEYVFRSKRITLSPPEDIGGITTQRPTNVDE